jgi:RimJ/RimL family protein N-acetyltransferase
MPSTLTTERLRLVPIPIDCTNSPDEREAIARATGARVPESWPAEHYDQEALDYTRKLLESDPGTEYVMRYLVTRDEPAVIGMFGCGPPDADGRVIIGYSVIPEYQRRGFASEALRAIIEWVRGQPTARIVAGDTYPHLIASIRTMEHCGLTFVGAGDGQGVIRYELRL